MKITIIAAMEQELTAIVNQIEHREYHQKLGFPVYEGTFNQHHITVCQSGIGKVHAGIRTALMLHDYNPEWIINVGSAGSTHPEVQIHDLILGSHFSYFDVDVTHFGYDYGQLPEGMPLHYHSDYHFNEQLHKSAQQHRIPLQQGLIVSGDQFVANLQQTEHIHSRFTAPYAIDMESCAIAQTCYMHNTPFSVLRAVSDHANQDSPVKFYEFLDKISDQYSKIIFQALNQ